MQLHGIDHVVLYAEDLDRTVEFYTRVLGMAHHRFDEDYDALHFGDQKINLHRAAAPYSPHARKVTPGGLDLCLTATGSMGAVVAHLERHGVEIIEGPCAQTGARGSMTSVYFHDPDGNLIEVATYGDALPQ